MSLTLRSLRQKNFNHMNWLWVRSDFYMCERYTFPAATRPGYEQCVQLLVNKYTM